MKLYHYSDRDDIDMFRPRAPLRHPESEPPVYGIDEWHSPLYLFPRDCPRIGVWPVDETSAEDRAAHQIVSRAKMLLLLDRRFEVAWRAGSIVEYELDAGDGFVDTGDHGVWVSRRDVTPRSKKTIADLPFELTARGAEVVVADSLVELAGRYFDFGSGRFVTSLHVSMVRMSQLAGWPGQPGSPVLPSSGPSSE